MTLTKRSDTLVCIPCFNSERTLPEVLRAVFEHSDADILLVDDHSDLPLTSFVRKQFPDQLHRITVLRADEKLYCGGCKNLGIKVALERHYRTAVFLDSDIVCQAQFFQATAAFFQAHPEEVLVSAGILPWGKGFQYADTLINFSSYLPRPQHKASRRDCLAGYAFALNLDVFGQKPVFFQNRTSGDDVLFFRTLALAHQMNDFPLLNHAAVTHKPPRQGFEKARSAQLRYALAFFTYNDCRRAHWFNKVPWLHLLTPRCWLMTIRLVQRRRFADLRYLARCWFLDFIRAVEIVRLVRSGHRDAANTFGPIR